MAAQSDQGAESLFSLLLKGLYHLAYGEGEAPLEVTNVYMLLYAEENGYKPCLNHCARCGQPISSERGARLDIEAGGLCCGGCARGEQFALNAQQVEWIQDVFRSGFDVPLRETDTILFEAFRRYLESRLECTIKSSQFLP